LEAARGDILARLRELERRVDAQEMVRNFFCLSTAWKRELIVWSVHTEASITEYGEVGEWMGYT
jgi:hypothetical protein